jgi:hypothetical protein
MLAVNGNLKQRNQAFPSYCKIKTLRATCKWSDAAILGGSELRSSSKTSFVLQELSFLLRASSHSLKEFEQNQFDGQAANRPGMKLTLRSGGKLSAN